MPSDEASEYVQYLLTDLEVELDLHWNPIARAAADKSMELFERGLSSSHSMRYLDPPGIPDVPLFGEPNFWEVFEARVAALNRATWVGCEFTYSTRSGDVSAEFWVRNTEHAGVSPLGLAEDVGGLLAAQRAIKIADEAAASF